MPAVKDAPRFQKPMGYTMPPVSACDQVVWHTVAGDPRSATNIRVTRVSVRSIDGIGYREDGKIFVVSDLHHIDDPDLESHPSWRANGTWDYTDQHKLLMDLDARVTALENQRK